MSLKLEKGDGSYRFEGGEFNLLVKKTETGKGVFETEYIPSLGMRSYSNKYRASSPFVQPSHVLTAWY